VGVLFSPDRHEPLSERTRDEPWIRERIDAIAADAVASRAPDGLWPEHPDDHDDVGRIGSGLYMGAAGIVWALHALGHDHPELIVDLHGRYLAEPDWPGAVPGYWVGEAGILLVAQLLQPEPARADLLERAIRANAGNETNELMWGAPGTMLAALAMHRRSGEERWADAWRASAGELWSRWLPHGEGDLHVWTQLLYGDTARYVGPGHGFAGNVLALWLGRHLLDEERVAELERRAVTTATALAVREDGLANWPPTVGPLAHRGRIRTQWCHGAPGMIASLAPLAPADETFTALLLEAGELTWRAGPLAGGAGLCHGTAGNGLAFLALHARTGDDRWLDRAHRFAVHALEQVEEGRERHGFGRHSLWTGDLGVAVMAASCLDERPGMPTLDWV
jgi:hypothetical protein